MNTVSNQVNVPVIAPESEEVSVETIRARRRRRIVVNSLRVLILAARALKGRHGRLVFARPQPLVARLLEITDADRLLEVQE